MEYYSDRSRSDQSQIDDFFAVAVPDSLIGYFGIPNESLTTHPGDCPAISNGVCLKQHNGAAFSCRIWPNVRLYEATRNRPQMENRCYGRNGFSGKFANNARNGRWAMNRSRRDRGAGFATSQPLPATYKSLQHRFAFEQ